jgi:flagellar biosynthesis chaperone FliJ
MSAIAGRADMRAFQWRLAALERKLEHDLGRAHTALAALQREAASLDTVRREMADVQAAHLRRTAALVPRKLDPTAYRACLHYLALAEDRLHQHRCDAEQLAARVADARRACLDADRKLASLRSLRERDEAAYATEQSRRRAREDDLAWLANAATATRSAARRAGDRP